MIKTVVIDPGHGGNDPGAVMGKRIESDEVLKMSIALVWALNEQGLRPLLTRNKDTDVNIKTRTLNANKVDADLFISIHRNAFTQPDANGVEVWTYTLPTPVEKAAAAIIMEELSKTPIQSNRGVKNGNYGVLRDTNMPAVMVELGFITNPEDNSLFDKHFDEYVKALCKGICKILDVDYHENPQPFDRCPVGHPGKPGATTIPGEDAQSLIAEINRLNEELDDKNKRLDAIADLSRPTDE